MVRASASSLKAARSLQRTAAARQQQHVVAAGGIRAAQHFRGLRRRTRALHRDRQHFDLDQRKTPPQDAQHVAHRRAGRRGDHAQAPHVARQRSLARSLEQALGGQPRLELLEGALQGALSGFLHAVDHQLVLATRFVDREPGADQHLHAVGRAELQPLRLRLEEGTAHLGAGVLQREIQMPGGRPRHAREFALHPNEGEGALQQVARERVELRRREDGAFGGHVGL